MNVEDDLKEHDDQPSSEAPTHCERFLADDCEFAITLTLEAIALVQEIRSVKTSPCRLDSHREDGNVKVCWPVLSMLI